MFRLTGIISIVILLTFRIQFTKSECRCVEYLHFDKEYCEYPALGLMDWLVGLNIYCYKHELEKFKSIAGSVYLEVEVDDYQYYQYIGGTAEEVLDNFKKKREIYDGIQCGLYKGRKIIQLNAFQTVYFILDSKLPYHLTLRQKKFDLQRISRFTCGLLLYASAATLSNSYLWNYILTSTLSTTLTAILFNLYSFRLLPSAVEGKYHKTLSIGTGCWLNTEIIYENFKLMFWRNQIISIILLFSINLYALFSCFKLQTFWRQPNTRRIHYTLLRGMGYWMIFFSSDYYKLTGLIVIGLMFCPKILICKRKMLCWFFALKQHWNSLHEDHMANEMRTRTASYSRSQYNSRHNMYFNNSFRPEHRHHRHHHHHGTHENSTRRRERHWTELLHEHAMEERAERQVID